MKPLRLFVLFLNLIILGFAAQEAIANVYASDIRVTNPDGTPFDGNFTDGTGAMLTFVLNDTAVTVSAQFIDLSIGGAAITFNLGSLGRGEHSVIWDGTGAATGRRYVATVTAEQPTYSLTDYTMYIYIDSRIPGHNIFTRGVDSYNNPASRKFGFIYASNDGGPLLTGILRFRADGGYAGTNPGNPLLGQTLSTEEGGTVDWGTFAPWHCSVDYAGRIYATGVDSGEVWRLDNDESAPKVVISSLTRPRGLAPVGQGEDFKLYIAADRFVLRANIGTADTYQAPLDTIAALTMSVRDVILDDEGFMYVTLRTDDGTNDAVRPGALERYDISGTLPVTSAQAFWSIPFTGRPISLAMDRGASRATADDDLLYMSQRGDGTADRPGLYLISDIKSPFASALHLWEPNDFPPTGGGDVNSRSDITVDVVGNLIYFENGNETIHFFSPPSDDPTNTYTTVGLDTINADVATSVAEDLTTPHGFVLHQNYPNPFNPETTIQFRLPQDAFVTLKVYDLVGRELATLVDGYLTTGIHAVVFRADHLSSGTYIYVLQGGGFSNRKKMALVK